MMSHKEDIVDYTWKDFIGDVSNMRRIVKEMRNDCGKVDEKLAASQREIKHFLKD